ncbi:carbohydrate sulfotransferase 4-like [Rhinophrynus dorsalis]
MRLRITCPSFIIFSVLLTFSLSFLFHFISHKDLPQEKRVHILIISSWRSGSSFLGQIFNQHPNVFYLFEPARVVWVKFPGESVDVLHYPVRDLLRSLFSCDMSPLHSYLPRGGRDISDLPFWAESWALCSPPACTALDSDDGYDRPTCFLRCGQAPLEKMSEACTTHSHVVMKVVRILDLSTLLPLFQDASLDLRVIHLVRDPRAVAASRLSFDVLQDDNLIVTGGREAKEKRNGDPNLTQVMAKICSSQVAINEFSRLAETSLKGRYMMIRYEDLAREPVYNVQRIYSFAGLKLTGKLQMWVHNVTHQWGPYQSGFTNFAMVSQEIVQKWRKHFNHSIVREIQEECKEAMEVFGYSPVKSLKEQKDFKLDVIKDIETNRFDGHDHFGV